MDVVAETVIRVYRGREVLRGYEMIHEAPLLRHFSARFAPVVDKGRGDRQRSAGAQGCRGCGEEPFEGPLPGEGCPWDGKKTQKNAAREPRQEEYI